MEKIKLTQIDLKQQQSLKLNQAQTFALSFLECRGEDAERIILDAFNENPFVEYTPKTLSTEKDFFNSVLDSYIEEKSLKDVLREQVLEIGYSHDDIMNFLVHSIDEYGYFPTTIYDFITLAYPKASRADIDLRMKLIQKFEPLGVGALNLGDCIRIQTKDHYYKNHIAKICDYLLPDVAVKNYQLISSELNCEYIEVLEIVEIIKQCDPRPGLQYPSKEHHQSPDIYIDTLDSITITLNNDFSSFKVNTDIQDTLDLEFSKKLEQAKLLQYSIHKRNQTLLDVMNCIVNFQKDYFENKTTLKAMTQKDVAVLMSLHESTISRAIKDKIISLNGEIYPLKYFFSEPVSETFNQNDIIRLIKNIIKQESKSKPLSDSKIAKELEIYDIYISRRTVSKYRSIGRIPDSSNRKHSVV